MKKLGIILLSLFGILSVQSQDLIKPDTTKVWTQKGNFSLLFNQSNFNNWAAGETLGSTMISITKRIM